MARQASTLRGEQARSQQTRCPMKLLKKLNNPFLLGLQGFVAGAFLFFATHPGAVSSIVGSKGSETSQQHVHQSA
jgi:hypothetical protein